jgi:BRCT domain type II-containing protein
MLKEIAAYNAEIAGKKRQGLTKKKKILKQKALTTPVKPPMLFVIQVGPTLTPTRKTRTPAK